MAAEARQSFPQLGTAFVDKASGIISIPWYKLLEFLWASVENPQPAQQINVPGSPFTFVAPRQGTLLVNDGIVEISRDNGVLFYQAGQRGGAVPVLVNDVVRVTLGSPPSIVFLPS